MEFDLAYSEILADRVRPYLMGTADFAERKMFGGLCFTINSHMTCGIVEDRLMVRVGPKYYEEALQKKYVSVMDFSGKPMTGYVFVEPAGIKSDADLKRWTSLAIAFVSTLPPKVAK